MSNFNESSEYHGYENRGQQQESHPALFGQSQVKGGFGPVYAIPSFPWQHGEDIGPAYATPSVPWQHEGGQGPATSPPPPLGQREYEYDQSSESGHWQHGEDLGPIYAIPSIPWQHGGGQGSGSGPWQQWDGYTPTNMPYCNCPVGHHHYW